MAKKVKTVLDSMRGVGRGSTSKPWLDQPAHGQCRDEIRRYLALCVAGKMTLNIRELTKRHVNGLRGIPITEATVRNWMDRDVICGPMREHIDTGKEMPEGVKRFIAESVKWMESEGE